MNEIQEQSENNLMTLADPGIIAIGQRAEKLVAALKIIRAAVLKLTNEKDWENLGGKPYLNEGGAKKVGAAFGVSWQLDVPVREDLEDGHCHYHVSGQFEFHGTKVQEIGTRSSRDDFFAKAKGKEIPASEIDRNDVKKSAVTNCIARGVKAVLALKNFTWEELQAAGIERDKMASVEYGARSADPNAALPLPNYGTFKGRPMDDSAIPIEELQYYLSGAEKSLADPAKAKYKAQNEKMRDALKAEIATRTRPPASVPAAPVAPAAPSAHPESAPGPVTGSAAGGEVEAEWLSGVLDCEDVLRGTTQGTGILRSIRAGFKLADGAYPLLPAQQEEYRVTLVKAVERMQGR